MRNADMPAMPAGKVCNVDENGWGVEIECNGLTKREEFAKFMMGSLAASGGQYQKWEHLAQDAIAMTDALLAELERTK